MSTTLTILSIQGIDGPSLTTPGEAITLGASGDPALLGFTSTNSAVSCALQLIDEHPTITIGIEVGDVDPDDDSEVTDRSPIGKAIGLGRLAAAGEIRVSEVLRLLLGEPGDFEVRSTDDSPNSYLLTHARPSSTRVMDMGLPSQLQSAPGDHFVDRPDAWETVCGAWDDTLGGRRRSVLVAGEAGAGKTRLLTEFARHAADRDAIVIYGSSLEDVGVPFQPFVEAFQPVLGTIEPQVLDEILTVETRRDLGRILPQVAEMTSSQQVTPTSSVITAGIGPEADRHWAFEAVVSLLEGLASHAPVLLLLDDLHWARPPTVRLTEHVLRSNRLDRVCMVAAYRDTPGDQTDVFAEALSNLYRSPGVSRTELGGFDEESIRTFVATATGSRDVPQSLNPLIGQLLERTGGSPFLVSESWKHLIASHNVVKEPDGWALGSVGAIESPRSVREFTGHRMSRLPHACRELLELGACIGMSFEVNIIAPAAKQSIAVALDLLGQAVDNGLLVQSGSSRFSFLHALVQQAIEDSLTAADRPARHLAIAHSLQSQNQADAALLAHHYAGAVPLEPSSTAVAFARLAASQSIETVSFDEAITVLRTAMEVTSDDLESADLRADQAAAYARGGSAAEAAEACVEVADLARRHQDPERLVRAATGLAEATWLGALHGDPAVALLNETLELDHDPDTRCALLSSLSTSLAFAGRDPEATAAGEQAVALATELDDTGLLLQAIHNSLYVTADPEHVRDQLDLALRGVDIATKHGDTYAELQLGCKAILRLFVSSDPRKLAELDKRNRQLVKRIRLPYYLKTQAGFDFTIALAEGRFVEAEQAADLCQEWAIANSQADTSSYGIQMFSLRREQGRLAELRPVLEMGARLNQEDSSWAPGLAAVYAEVDMIPEATSLLDTLADGDLASIPRDTVLPGVLSYLADATFATNHSTMAKTCLSLLSPYENLLIYVPGLACYGSADRYIGKLHEVLDQRAEARLHYERALDVDTHAGWDTWIAHSSFSLGQLLMRSDEPADRARGTELLDQAAETAKGLGMTALASRCASAQRLGADVSASPPPTGGLTPRELEVLALVAIGHSNRETGEILHASQHTIANHVRSILFKSECSNRTEASAWARRHGLVDDLGAGR